MYHTLCSRAFSLCLILNKILVIFHINKQDFQVLTPIFSQEKEKIVWQLKH